jgi:hypothetical protein
VPVTLNLKKGIDLPVFQWLRFLPAASAAGSCMATDKRGTHRFIYIIFSATGFWRYDTWTDSYEQLASPPSITFAAGVSMIFDPSRGAGGYVWLLAPLSSSPWCVFAYYDVAANAWTSRAVPAGLAAQWATDSCLAHTCTTYNAGGNDDYIYLIGNGSATWYRYSVVGNAWSTMAPALPATALAGCHITWPWGFNVDRLYFFRGGASATLYYFTISAPAWSADVAYKPKTETFTTGACMTYDTLNRIYIVKDATQRMYCYQLDEDKMYPAGVWPYTSGTAIVGDALVYIKTVDGAEYLYFRRHSGTEFWRMLIGWF